MSEDDLFKLAPPLLERGGVASDSGSEKWWDFCLMEWNPKVSYRHLLASAD